MWQECVVFVDVCAHARARAVVIQMRENVKSHRECASKRRTKISLKKLTHSIYVRRLLDGGGAVAPFVFFVV
jgi:hypothetical protein